MKKNVKYFEILSYKDLEKALAIAKQNLNRVAVEDEIDSLNYISEYDDFNELEKDVWRWFNRTTSSYTYDNDDTLVTALVIFDNDLYFETIHINAKDRMNYDDFIGLVK